MAPLPCGSIKSSSLSTAVAAVIIFLAALLVYYNSFAVPLLLDDVFSIQDNPQIRHLLPIWKALSPSPTSFVGGRPAINFSFAINYALSGLDVRSYHALNLAIHILAGLTLLGIVRRTLLQPRLRDRFGPSALNLALTVAVLWTIHPLQTETVTYISERCESLMGLFYLLTLYCFIRGANSENSTGWFTLSTAACLLGMTSKEVMVTAPLMVFLYDRTFVSGTFREAWKRHGRLYLALAGTWLLLGFLMVGVQYRGVGFGGGITWSDYALTECRAVVNYLWLGFWPHPLVFDYGPEIAVRRIADVWLYGLVLSLLLVGMIWALVQRPVIGFLGAWFFLILAPSSSVVPAWGQPMAENRVYLSLAAVVVAVVIMVNHFCRNLWERHTWSEQLRVRLQVAMVIGLAFALGLTTIHRNAQYHSAESIWSDVIAKRPESFRAHYNLARALAAGGATNRAIAQLQETLRHAPDYAPAHVTLADILVGLGDQKAALEHYLDALTAEPHEQAAHFNLAQLFVRLGQRDQAITQYMEVVTLDPRNATAHYNLANLLADSGQEAEAISHYTAAAQFDPKNPRSEINLGNLFLKEGRTNEVIAAYTAALHSDPNSFKAHNNLAVILVNRGDLVHATEHFREAARLMPNTPEVHAELAEVLERQALHEESQRERTEAQRLRGSGSAP